MSKKNSSDYIRAKYRQIVLKFEIEKDREIIHLIEEQPNMTDFVRGLINEVLHHGKETEQI